MKEGERERERAKKQAAAVPAILHFSLAKCRIAE